MQCNGLTKTGLRCRREVKHVSCYCFSHRPLCSSNMTSSSSNITSSSSNITFNSKDKRSINIPIIKSMENIKPADISNITESIEKLAISDVTIPTVVNVRAKELRKNSYRNIQDWLDKSDNNLYIGRNMRISLGGGEWAYLKTSKWHNPFKGERQDVVVKFEEYARNKFNEDDYVELKGKTLGCWCHPESCHGHVLIKLYNEYIK